MEEDNFWKACNRAREIVASWPEWKRRDIFAQYESMEFTSPEEKVQLDAFPGPP